MRSNKLSFPQNVDQSIENSQSDKPKLQQAFANLDLLVKLFLDLSCQDLPPMFEDGLPHIATFLHKYLVYDNPLLHSTDDSEASPLEFVKAGILEALVLYTSKYGDAFGDYVQQFMTATWNLLSATGTEVKYDILVSKALQFMTQVTKISGLGLFDTEHVLNSIVEKVIIPNLSLRDADIEILEEEPIEFVRRDLEGPDSDTRRKAATDFLRQLLETPNSQITPVVMRYIDHYMSEYAKSPKDNWRSKDLAIYLFTSIAAKGISTTSHGITSTNQLVDIGDFFQKNIASDLTSEDAETILKMDALKYLYTFRNVLNKDQWQQILPVLVNRLGSSDYVVYTYAAIVVERVLALTDSAHQPIIDQAMITPLAKDLIEHLFKLIEQNPAPEKVQENEFLMRCVMRVIIFIREGVISVAGIVLAHLIGITNTISSNPSNPRFYYYHFEALGAFIRFAAPSSASTLENALYQPFAIVLQNNTEEFLPYVLQLFAFLLEANPSGTLPDMYQSMLGPLLTPPLWEQKGNVPALVRLLSALMSRMTSLIVENGQIEPILGIFQKLVSSKTNESYGFDLLEAVVTTFPPPAIQPFFGAVLGVIFARLSKTRTENLALKFTRWYHVVSARQDKGLGADFFIAGADQTQHE
jgi:exportin-2 (importin alpha re-exporter)